MKAKHDSHSIHSCMPSPPLSCTNRTVSQNVPYSTFQFPKYHVSFQDRPTTNYQSHQKLFEPSRIISYCSQYKPQSATERSSSFQVSQQRQSLYQKGRKSEIPRESQQKYFICPKRIQFRKEQYNPNIKKTKLSHNSHIKSQIETHDQNYQNSQAQHQHQKQHQNQGQGSIFNLQQVGNIEQQKQKLFRQYRQGKRLTYKGQRNLRKREEDINEQIQTLQQKVRSLKNQKDTLQLAIAKDKEILQLSQKNKTLISQIQNQKYQTKKLNDQLVELAKTTQQRELQLKKQLREYEVTAFQAEKAKQILQKNYVDECATMQRDIGSLRDNKKNLEEILRTKELLIKFYSDNNEMLKKEMLSLSQKNHNSQALISDISKKNEFLHYDLNNFKTFHEHQIGLANQDGSALRARIFQLQQNIQHIMKEKLEFVSFKNGNEFSLDSSQGQIIFQPILNKKGLKTRHSVNTNASLDLDMNTVLVKIQSEAESINNFQRMMQKQDKKQEKLFALQNVFSQSYDFKTKENRVNLLQNEFKSLQLQNNQLNILVKELTQKILAFQIGIKSRNLEIQELKVQIQNFQALICQFKKDEHDRLSQKDLSIEILQNKYLDMEKHLKFQLDVSNYKYSVALSLLQDLKTRQIRLQNEIYLKNCMNGEHMKYIEELLVFRKIAQKCQSGKNMRNIQRKYIRNLDGEPETKQLFLLTEQSEQCCQQLSQSKKQQIFYIYGESPSPNSEKLAGSADWARVQMINQDVSEQQQEDVQKIQFDVDSRSKPTK